MTDQERIVGSAAHFVVCKNCQMHGHIVFSDGSKSIEACSVTAAREEAADALANGKLLEDEMPELRRQINASGLAFGINVGDFVSAGAELLKLLGGAAPSDAEPEVHPECVNQSAT